MGPVNSKKRIVILGGGMSGVAAAFGITESPNWQEEYDITVYQLGWRLGGKGASGRNSAHEQRIEEHGLHVWGGFYENAFRVIRACYQELGRPPTAPLATWDEAFKPSALVSWMEDLEPWLVWNNRFQEYSSTPGDGTPMPGLWEGLLRLVEWLIQTYFDDDPTANTPQPVNASADSTGRISGLSAEALHWIENAVHVGERKLLIDAYKIMRSASSILSEHSAGTTKIIVSLLQQIQSHRQTIAKGANDHGKRRAEILIDLAIAEVKGIIEDGVVTGGFEAINDIDLVAWFIKHGAHEASVQSGVVRGSYNFIFAYENGDPSKPFLEAGTGLRMIFRLIMWYKGAIFWKMQAGMGDTVFAPLYLVLKARGVKFAFFQQVLQLSLSSDKSSIEAITIGEQATLKNGPYEPLVDVESLPCWPSEPLYDQLVQGEQLRNEGIDLESPWSPWQPVDTYQLLQGQDFDSVVLATSFAPINDIGKELIANSASWQAMMANVKTTQTQAFQLWMIPQLANLGWNNGPTVLTGYSHPFETWADMSQTIVREEWPAGQQPGSIAYFCGCLPDADPIPPYSDHQFLAQQRALAKQNAIDWISHYIMGIWPKAGGQDSFDWNLLDDQTGGSGVARFDSQYWRANIAPAERYVLSGPNSTKHKLMASQSGFRNLYLAGDWVRNGLDFGCIESATMGGLQASRAICGYPKVVVGENDDIYVTVNNNLHRSRLHRFARSAARATKTALNQ